VLSMKLAEHEGAEHDVLSMKSAERDVLSTKSAEDDVLSMTC
jgi:hypothetical protein